MPPEPKAVAAKADDEFSSGGDIPHNAGKRDSNIDDVESDGESEVEEDEYVVEDITGHKITGGVVLYDVAWVGYDEHSWEPVENLDGCPDKLQAYHDEIGGAPQPSNKKKSGRPPAKKESTSTRKRKTSGTDSDATERVSNGKGATKKARGGKNQPNVFRTEDGSKYVLPSGSWDDHGLVRVLGVEEVPDQDKTSASRTLQSKTLWDASYDNRIFMIPNNALYYKAPRKLLEYYESKLRFNSEDLPEVKSVDKGSKPTEARPVDLDDDDMNDIGEADTEDIEDDVVIKDVASG